MIYKYLFIGDEKLKYENLDEKVNDFKLILECLNGTLDSDKEKVCHNFIHKYIKQ